MHPSGASGGVLFIQLRRRQRIARLGAEVALEQAHHAAVTQVDGGDQLHQPSSRKLARMRAPTSAERSGWNCVA